MEIIGEEMGRLKEVRIEGQKRGMQERETG